ncbi:MAG: flagellar hook-length control protein FliK [Anaerovoracaceae bacterium]
MNAESNFKVMCPLTFINHASSKDVFGLLSMGIESSHESGESPFLKMIFRIMAEGCFPAPVVDETLTSVSDDEIESFNKQTIGSDIFPNLIFDSVRSAHGLQIVGQKSEKDITIDETKDSVIKEVQEVQYFSSKGEVQVCQPSGIDTAEEIPVLMGLTKSIQSSKFEMPSFNTPTQLKKEDSVKINVSQGDTQVPSVMLPQDHALNIISSNSGAAEWTLENSSTSKIEPYSQISELIISKLEQKGPTEFKMLLEPRTLGEINIKLKIVKGKLTIDILAAKAETQTLLTSQVDKLITSMGLRNVQVESIQISQQMLQNQVDQSHSHNMSADMEFFHRKNQEQHRQRDFFHEGKRDGSHEQLLAKAQDSKEVNGIGAHLYDSHRINYAI